MNVFFKSCLFLLFITSQSYALGSIDRNAIEEVIQDYTHAWNDHTGEGFADNFSEDADFVNIFNESQWKITVCQNTLIPK